MRVPTIVRVIQRALPSVVSLRSILSGTESYAIPTEGEGLGGSGFVVASDGTIVTNKHVVANLRDECEVITQDGKRFRATILARDPASDIAFLKIERHDIPPLPLGSAKTLMLGETVIAIGNALGQFANTVSAGIVSGLSRSLLAALDEEGNVEELEGLIQTDAAINPGNSGGPLVNLLGEAVGVNIATVLGAQNLGFAIPIDVVRRDLEDLRRFGRVRRAYLGIRYLPVDEIIAREYHLPRSYGALVCSAASVPAVAPHGPAARAGIRERDLIIAVNGEVITPEKTFAAMLAQAPVDQPIRLTVLRGRRRLQFSVTPTEWRGD
jgi:serine protease Do